MEGKSPIESFKLSFFEWDYKAKKCPQCEDGIIGESDWGVSIMAD